MNLEPIDGFLTPSIEVIRPDLTSGEVIISQLDNIPHHLTVTSDPCLHHLTSFYSTLIPEELFKYGSVFRAYSGSRLLAKELEAMLPDPAYTFNVEVIGLGHMPFNIRQINNPNLNLIIYPSNHIPTQFLQEFRHLCWERTWFGEPLPIKAVWFVDNGEDLPDDEVVEKLLSGTLPIHLPTLLDTLAHLKT